METLTADEVAAWLKISKRHVYELVKKRTRSGDLRKNPLPCVRFGKSVRFSKAAVEQWIEKVMKPTGSEVSKHNWQKSIIANHGTKRVNASSSLLANSLCGLS